MADLLPSRGIKPDLCWFERPRAINPSFPRLCPSAHPLVRANALIFASFLPSLLPSFFHLHSYRLRFFQDPPSPFPYCFLRSRNHERSISSWFSPAFIAYYLKLFENLPVFENGKNLGWMETVWNNFNFLRIENIRKLVQYISLHHF